MSDGEHCCGEKDIGTVEKKWTQILINWVNRCVKPSTEMKELSSSCLFDIMKKYDKKLCSKAEVNALSVDDVDAILKKKYPSLMLRNLTQVYDANYHFKKLYIAITVLMYHSCVNKKTNTAAGDVCRKMEKVEMEMILNLCQRLKLVEITVVNVEAAIKAAYEATYGVVPVNWTLLRNKKKKDAKEKLDKEIAGVDSTPIGDCGCVTESKLETSENELKTLLSPADQQSEYSIVENMSLQQVDDVTPKDDNEEIVIKTIKPGSEFSSLEILELDVLEDNAQSCEANCTCSNCSKTKPSSSEPEEKKKNDKPTVKPAPVKKDVTK